MSSRLRWALLLLLVLPACTAPVPRSAATSDAVGDKDPRIQVWLGPTATLHPHLTSPHIAAALASPLVASDPRTHLPAWGADAPDALVATIRSEDLRRWQLTIKSGWRWTDGTPVTAADLERGWRTAMAEGLPLASTLTDVRARDDVTLAFALRAPFAGMPQLLTHQTFLPLPPAADDDPEGFAEQPMGYGPYRLAGRAGDVLALEAVPGHPLADEASAGDILVSLRARPGVEDDVVIGADGDLSPLDGPGGDARTAHIRSPGRQLAYLGVPLTDPAYVDVEVRQALSLAIDRKALAEDILEGAVLPATRLVGPGFARSGDVTCDVCTYDAERARQLWPDDPPDPLTLWFAADAGHEPVVRAIAEGWQRELGAEDIRFGSLAQGALIDRITGNDVDGPFRLSWQADVAAPVRLIEPLLGPRGAANDVRFRSEALADLLAVAGAERDPQKGLVAYATAEELVLDQVPIIPLWFSTIPVSSRPQVTGIGLDGEGRLRWAQLGR